MTIFKFTDGFRAPVKKKKKKKKTKKKGFTVILSQKDVPVSLTAWNL